LNMASGKLTSLALIHQVKQTIPRLTGAHHKGQHGRLAVIGGCFEYTGAPYVSAISAARTGVDLAFVFCSKDAAIPIKAYGPELIVVPALRTSTEIREERTPPTKQEIVATVTDWLSRMHTVVIGPGLGRDRLIQETVGEIITAIKKKNLPIIIDGDGLWAVENDISLVQGYQRATLTPNVNEFGRLCKRVLAKDAPNVASETEKVVTELASKLGVTVVCKGEVDIISDGNTVVTCKFTGGQKRCGGLGDVLAGTIGTFTTWATLGHGDVKPLEDEPVVSSSVLAAFGGCTLARDCAKACFEQKGRSMLAYDLVPLLGPKLRERFEQNEHSHL